MWNLLLQRVVDVSPYRTSVDKDHARLVYGALLLLEAIFLIYAIAVPDWSLRSMGVAGDVPLLATLPYRPDAWVYVFGSLGLFGLGMYWLRQGKLDPAGWIPTFMLYVMAVLPTLNSTGTHFNSAIGSVVLCGLIIVSGLLNGYLGILVGVVASTATLIIDPGPEINSSIVVILMLFLGIGGVSALYTRFAVLSRGEGEVEANVERLKLADLTSKITRKASQRASLQDVLDLAIDLILEKYPQFYHAQIFLIDESGIESKLTASTGEVGKVLLARAHSLTVGSLSVIGQVTIKGEALIARAGSPDSMHRFNELLPETRIEAAFPLHTGDTIIGALDLQSRGEYAFTDEDVPTFQSLADSISLVIDNVRQFESARQRVQENQRLAEQARNALREVERLNKRLIGRAWTEFLHSQSQNIGLNVDFATGKVENDPFWTSTLDEAARVNHTVQKSNVLSVPLRVRGQIIGAMEFEMDENAEFSPEDLELVQEISDRFGLAAENTRLVEESQRIAQREALINEISSRMQSTNNVEATLTEAARSLFETLQARRVSIRLGAPAARPRKEAAG
jgi:GAF domain-containing protein